MKSFFVEVNDLIGRHTLRKSIALAMLGAFALSVPLTVDAKRVHDPALEAKVSNERKGSLQERIDAILHPEKQQSVPTALEESEDEWSEDWSDEIEFTVPTTLSVTDPSIIGTPMASQSQCVRYLLRNNPNPNIAVSAEEIVQLYYEEGEREGIRPDVALCQAFKETGFFRYGGTVTPDQNNYCGLGTTSALVKGSSFPNPQIGEFAHTFSTCLRIHLRVDLRRRLSIRAIRSFARRTARRRSAIGRISTVDGRCPAKNTVNRFCRCSTPCFFNDEKKRAALPIEACRPFLLLEFYSAQLFPIRV